MLKTKATRGDLLTAVDGEAQEVIEAAVRAAFPAHAFLGERSRLGASSSLHALFGPSSDPSPTGEESVPAGATASADALRCALDACGSDWLWVVDSLDGTRRCEQRLFTPIAVNRSSTLSTGRPTLCRACRWWASRLEWRGARRARGGP